MEFDDVLRVAHDVEPADVAVEDAEFTNGVVHVGDIVHNFEKIACSLALAEQLPNAAKVEDLLDATDTYSRRRSLA